MSPLWLIFAAIGGAAALFGAEHSGDARAPRLADVTKWAVETNRKVIFAETATQLKKPAAVIRSLPALGATLEELRFFVLDEGRFYQLTGEDYAEDRRTLAEFKTWKAGQASDVVSGILDGNAQSRAWYIAGRYRVQSSHKFTTGDGYLFQGWSAPKLLSSLEAMNFANDFNRTLMPNRNTMIRESAYLYQWLGGTWKRVS